MNPIIRSRNLHVRREGPDSGRIVATRKLDERKLSREILKAAEQTGVLSIIVGSHPLRATLACHFSEHALGQSPVRIWQTRFR